MSYIWYVKEKRGEGKWNKNFWCTFSYYWFKFSDYWEL